MACRDAVPGVVNRKVAYGTKDFLEEPALVTMEETVKAMEAGADMAVELEGKRLCWLAPGKWESAIPLPAAPCFPYFLIWTRNCDGPGAGLTTAVTTAGAGHKEGIRIRKPSRGSVDALSSGVDWIWRP